MIDLHSHYLPGIDDGSPDMDTTLSMLSHAQDLGFRGLLATPHINEHTTPEIISQIQERFKEVEAAKNKAGLKLELRLSGEIHLDTHILEWMHYDFLKIGDQKKYIIIELPIQGLPLKTEDMIFNLGLKGITPIMAHPERNVFVQQKPGIIERWLDLGCIMQMNAGSITGNFGSGIKELAWQMLKRGYIHLVCSDAHNNRSRNYGLQITAFQLVAQEISQSYADILFLRNPQRIWDGKKIVIPELNAGNTDQPMHEKLLKKIKTGFNRAILSM